MVSIWKYKRDDLQNYLVLYLSSGHIVNDFEIKMSSNLSNVFLTPIYDENFEKEANTEQKTDNIEITMNRVIRYPISNAIVLSKYLESNQIDGEKIIDIMEKIISIYYLCVDYLLIPEQIVFDMDKIFVDFRTGQVYMIYIPVENYSDFSDLNIFLISFLKKAMILDHENRQSYSEIIKYCDSENFCVGGFKNILSYFKKEMKHMGYGKNYRHDKSKISFEYLQTNGFEELEDDFKIDGPSGEELKNNLKGKGIKFIFLKGFTIYTVLILIYIVVMRNSSNFFGNSSQIRILISLLFIALSLYIYLKFINCDVLDFLHEKKENKCSIHRDNNREENEYRLHSDKSKNETKNSMILKNNNQRRNRYIERNLPVSNLNKRGRNYFDERRFQNDLSSLNEKKYLEEDIKSNDINMQNRRNALNHYYFENEGDERNGNIYQENFHSDRNKGQYENNNKYCETELLIQKNKNYLINLLTGEKVYLIKNPFKIGRHEDENDYILDEKTIGRFHVQFDINEEEVSITDLGSKNGTFINDIRIYPYTKEFLNVGDVVKIADVAFLFNK